jgi:hypothetical protein
VFANVTMAELQTQSFLIGLVLGAIAGVAGLILAAMVFGEDDAESKPQWPRCHHCNARLRPVMVADLTYPMPEGAKWVCPGSFWWQLWFPRHIQCYFADHPAKPAPVEEV